MSKVAVKSITIRLPNGELQELSVGEARDLYESLKDVFEKPTTYKFELGSTLPSQEEVSGYKSPAPNYNNWYSNWYASNQWGK